MVGDRHLTDVVFGNRNGLLSVHVAPIDMRGEPAAVGLARALQCCNPFTMFTYVRYCSAISALNKPFT